MDTILTIYRKIDFSGWSSFEKKLVSIVVGMIMAATFYFSYTTPSKDFSSWLMNWLISPVASITGIKWIGGFNNDSLFKVPYSYDV